MNRFKMAGLVALIALASLTTIGCADKEKQQLTELTNQYNELSYKNQQLQGELAQAKSTEADLLTQLDVQTQQLAAKDRQIGDLQRKSGSTATVPPAGGVQTGWEEGLTGARVSVGSDVIFASGRATLTPAGQKALDKIVGDLRNAYSGLPVRVYGYTDNDPIQKTKNLWDDNLDLSANRAMAVTRYLISKGIKADRIETIAMGETKPVVPNKTVAEKQKNRRVEIVVIKK